MAIIREPEGVEFFVIPGPLTQEQEALIKACIAKNKAKKTKAEPKTSIKQRIKKAAKPKTIH